MNIANNIDDSMKKFIADVNLSKLVKKLRMLGIDCAYKGDYTIMQLFTICANENRILITDKPLPETKRVSVIRLSTSKMNEMLLELGNYITYDELIQPFSRCLKCNVLLTKIKKEDVLDFKNIKQEIPERIMNSDLQLECCETCRKIFWQGSHFQRMNDELMKLGFIKSSSNRNPKTIKVK